MGARRGECHYPAVLEPSHEHGLIAELDVPDLRVQSLGGDQVGAPKAQFDALSKQFKMLTAQGEWNPALFFKPQQGLPV